jgi:hypothetical protein
LIINYISKSCCSLSKKDLKIANFVSGVPLAIFSKNARILMAICIGYRQLNNTYFYLFTTAYTATPFVHQTFCLYNNYLILFILLKKKRKTDPYYVLKEFLQEILSLEASIQGEKIVNNNLQLDRLKLLLNEVLIALSNSKNNTNNTIRLRDLKY